MSSFEESLRRQEAERNAAYAQRQFNANQQFSAAHAAVPGVTRLLWEFVQGLQARGVPPRRIDLGGKPGMFRLPKHTPEGYALVLRNATGGYGRRTYTYVRSGALVTPDGRLWTKARGFMPITAETLLGETTDTRLYLDGDNYITFGPGGEAVVHRHGDPPTTTPLADFLATSAVNLIQEHGRMH